MAAHELVQVGQLVRPPHEVRGKRRQVADASGDLASAGPTAQRRALDQDLLLE